MEFQTLKRNRTKQIVIGGICAVAVLSVGVLATSKAKYKLTESFNIVNGTVNYKLPDFKVLAMYSSEDGKNYTEITGRMPGSGYVINEKESYCNIGSIKDEEAILKTVNGNHIISNLQKGSKCYLYFDKEKSPSEKTLENLGITSVNKTTPDFSKTSCTSGCQESTVGVYQAEDGMYSGTSYYWRGDVEDNHVIFADKCWRIVRINGDGSIRLIYNGPTIEEGENKTCAGNGANANSVLALTSADKAYNAKANRSEYVGYTYKETFQRPSDDIENTTTLKESNLKVQIDKWFNDDNNFTEAQREQVAEGYFCNDRNTASDTEWASQPTSSFHYAAYERINTTYKPTLDCSEEDIYTLKAGAITVDEANYAGGSGYKNEHYYLYNGQYYWTMSPYRWGGSSAAVFFVRSNGYLYGSTSVNSTTYGGVRPVINLKADTEFQPGKLGTTDSPYVVK